jgi:hypothetical protein
MFNFKFLVSNTKKNNLIDVIFKEYLDDLNDIDNTISLSERINNYISSVIFPGIPQYYPLKKKMEFHH